MSAENFRWYVVQARTNAEKSVAKDLKDRITRLGLEESFGDVLVPSEEIVEMKNGQKRVSERKFFPGYVLVQVATQPGLNGTPQMPNEAWHLIRETAKVTGFIGGTREVPLPISDAEAQRMLAMVKRDGEKPVLKSQFSKGQDVRIKEGPFNDFHGVIEDVDVAKGTVRVSVLIFGRPTAMSMATDHIEAVA